jgi:hypothetical protein
MVLWCPRAPLVFLCAALRRGGCPYAWQDGALGILFIWLFFVDAVCLCTQCLCCLGWVMADLLASGQCVSKHHDTRSIVPQTTSGTGRPQPTCPSDPQHSGDVVAQLAHIFWAVLVVPVCATAGQRQTGRMRSKIVGRVDDDLTPHLDSRCVPSSEPDFSCFMFVVVSARAKNDLHKMVVKHII